MQADRIKVIVAVVLCVIAVISVMNGMGLFSKTETPQDGIFSDGLESLDISRYAVLTRTALRSSYESWSRNPFVSTEIIPKEAELHKLSGIIWDEKNPIAIINNEIVSVGDRIGEALVTRIERTRVMIKLKDAEDELIIVEGDAE